MKKRGIFKILKEYYQTKTGKTPLSKEELLNIKQQADALTEALIGTNNTNTIPVKDNKLLSNNKYRTTN